MKLCIKIKILILQKKTIITYFLKMKQYIFKITNYLFQNEIKNISN